MSQKELILEYIDLHGSILPAKMAGKVFRGTMFGSETSKRCRELRALPSWNKNKLISYGEGKFERFARKVPNESKQTVTQYQVNQLFQLEIREQ